MAAEPKPYYTVEQYLEMEKYATEKHEYLSGEIIAMAGGSPAHNAIAANAIREIGNGLKGKPCVLYTGDQRIQVGPAGLYSYPDAVVACEEPRYGRGDSLLNPTVIIEVLSESTEAYDRGEKFEQYRRLGSLKEYVLISQNRSRVERFLLQEDGTWLFTDAHGLDASIRLESIGMTLLLEELYDKVELPPTGPPGLGIIRIMP